MEMVICPGCYGVGMVDTGSSEPDNPERLCDVCRGEGRVDSVWLRFYRRQQLRLGQCTRCHSDALVQETCRLCYRCWRKAVIATFSPYLSGSKIATRDD